MHDSAKFSLGLPQHANGDSFKSEVIAEEKLKFHDGQFMEGNGDVFYLNIFYQLNMTFSSCQNIDFEGIDRKKGEHTVSGSNSGIYCWNPIIMRYRIDKAKSPLLVLFANGSLKITSNDPSLHIVSLKAHIFLLNQGLKSQPILYPKNLSQKINFIENDQIKWEIDGIYYGGEYSITFGKCNDRFKINRVELSYQVLDTMLSGFEIDKCELKLKNPLNNLEIMNLPIKIQSKLEENYIFDC